MKTQSCGKQVSVSSDEKILVYFFSQYRTWQMSGKNLYGSTRRFDNDCANDKNISLGHKRAIKTNNSRKAVSTMTKVFGPFFLVSSTVENIREQFIEAPKLFWQLRWNLSELFLRPKRLLKAQIFQNKGNLSSEEKILAFLSRFIEHGKLMEQFKRAHKMFWLWLFKWEEHFFGTQEVDRNKFSKGELFSRWQMFLTYFSLYYRVSKTSRNIL